MTDNPAPTVATADTTATAARERQLEQLMRADFQDLLQRFMKENAVTIDEAKDLVLKNLLQGRASEEHG